MRAVAVRCGRVGGGVGAHERARAEVNGGAIEICKAFLTEEAPFDAAMKSVLRKSMRNFLDGCQRGLDANKKLLKTAADRQMQQMFDKSFDEMCQQIEPFLVEKKRDKKKGVKFA